MGVMARPMAREATAEMRRTRRVDERTALPRFRGDDVSRVLCFYLPLQLHRSPLETWCAAAIGRSTACVACQVLAQLADSRAEI